MSSQTLASVKHIKKSFKKDRQHELLVLDDVDLDIEEGKIIALLGKSGSGKSTLLRIIAGLEKPSAGEVFFNGKQTFGPVKGISMVFQNFALLPWLTVLQNVELGLEAQGVPKEERRERAIKAIDVIGLDGFESAYPKELSGGMCQRVGFARALVVEAELLIMDEPFSALDVLTAENLRNDLLDLWRSKKTNTRGILFVTHNIEEAVLIADKIIIFASNPGRIRSVIPVNIPYPRNESDPSFRRVVDSIYTLMTSETESERAMRVAKRRIGLGYRLPDADVSELTGLIETLVAEPNGRKDLPDLAEDWDLDIDDLFPLLEVLEILGFAKVSAGDIEVTDLGRAFAEADIQKRKVIFRSQLLNNVPLIAHINDALHHSDRQSVSVDDFLQELEGYFTEKEANRVLKTAIDLGRYAEVFAYDFNTGELSLENP